MEHHEFAKRLTKEQIIAFLGKFNYYKRNLEEYERWSGDPDTGIDVLEMEEFLMKRYKSIHQERCALIKEYCFQYNDFQIQMYTRVCDLCNDHDHPCWEKMEFMWISRDDWMDFMYDLFGSEYLNALKQYVGYKEGLKLSENHKRLPRIEKEYIYKQIERLEAKTN